MIKSILFIIFSTFLLNGAAQVKLEKLDAPLQNKIQSIDELHVQTKKLQASVQELKNKEAEFSSQNFKEIEEENVLKWTLVYTPAALLIILMFVVLLPISLNFNFKEALSENSHTKKTIKNPEYSAATINTIGSSIQNLSMLFPPTIEVTDSWPSFDDLVAISKSKGNSKKQAEEAFTSAEKELKTAEEGAKKAKESYDKLNNPANKKIWDDAEKIFDGKKHIINEITERLKKAKDEELRALKAIEEKIQWLEVTKRNNYQTAFNSKPSISRFIALLTILAIIVFVTSMSCFFIYHYIRTAKYPNFSALTGVIIALCIGVTPYIANKIATSIAANK